MDAERALLTAVVQYEDIAPVLEANILVRHFVNEDNAHAFEFIRDFWIEHDKIPTWETVDLDNPGVLLEEELPEPLSYYLSEMQTTIKFGILQTGVQDSMGELVTGHTVTGKETDRSADRLAVLLRDYHSVGSALTVVDVAQRGETWLAAYEHAAAHRHGVILPGNIPLGLDPIDKVTGGLRDENLVTVVGLPKSGKSLLLMFSALAAFRYGYRPMLVSFEMSVAEQEDRLHALNANVSLTRLVQRRLRKFEIDAVIKSHRQLERMGEFHIAQDPLSMTTVSALSAHIETYEPDVVFVDGVYMMEDEEGETSGSPQALTHITRSLKRLAQRARIPVIGSTQALEWKTTKKRGIRTNSVGYTSSFVQDSDLVLAIQQFDEEKPERKTYETLLSRIGAQGVRVTYDWDFDKTGRLLYVSDDEVEDEEVFDGRDI